MKKVMLYALMVLVFVGLANAAVMCEDKMVPGRECTMMSSDLNCTSYDYIILNDTDIVLQGGVLTQVDGGIYNLEFNQSLGSYLIRFCDNSTRMIIVEGEDEMASLAITLFILVCAGFLFALPWIAGSFVKNLIGDLVLKRCCWIIAIYLMMMNSAILATVADFAGIGLTNEMFRYMWFFGMAGWMFIGFVFIKTIVDVVELQRDIANGRRMGEE